MDKKVEVLWIAKTAFIPNCGLAIKDEKIYLPEDKAKEFKKLGKCKFPKKNED